MIDRRRFVQSMLALGAATGVRPSPILLAPSACRRVARPRRRGAVRRAQGGRQLRRHPHQPLPQSVHLHPRPPRPEHRQHRGLRLRRAGDRRRHVGLREQQQRDEGRDRARRGAGRRRSRGPTRRSTPSRCSSRRSRPTTATWNTPVEKNPFEMPLQPKLDLLLQINEEALKVPGASFVSAFMQFVNEHKYFASTEGLAHRAVADALLPVVLGDGGRSRDGQVLLAQLADGADGHGLRVRREPIRCSKEARVAAEEAVAMHKAKPVAGRTEDADPAPDEPVADDPRVGRPSDGARSRARLRGELRRHQLPHHRQARQVRVRLASS